MLTCPLNKTEQAAAGLGYLHSRGVVHGDLRGDNILVGDDWNVRISDFGNAVLVDATKTFSGALVGQWRWMAPELLQPEAFNYERAKKTRSTDVYSFGCLCVELYTGRFPFHDMVDPAALLFRIMNKKLLSRPTKGDRGLDMPEYVWSIVQDCWAHDSGPTKRLNMSQVERLLSLGVEG